MSMLLYINEVVFYTQRPFVQLILSGVFERFPRLKFVMTEAGLRVGAAAARPARHGSSEGIRDTGATGEIRYGDDQVLPRDATEYFHQNVWMGVSQPGHGRRRRPPPDRRSTGSCGAATTRTTRAPTRTPASTCGPGSRRRPEAEMREMLAENAADALRLRPRRARARWPRRSARPSPRSPTPIDAVPDKSLERLSGDMDARAIK